MCWDVEQQAHPALGVVYNQDLFEPDSYMSRPASTASARPIYLIIVLGLLVSAWTFFPGWMSNDSLIQYREARLGVFNSWHPVLMAWWWRQLDHLYQGPAPFLIQNLLMYWGGLGLLTNAIRRSAGQYAYIVPILGLWPALFFVLGEIWKDVAFACSLFMSWAIVINAYCWQRKTSWLERCILIILITFAIGVKTNGILAIPFLVIFWLYSDGVRHRKIFAVLTSIILSAAILVPYGVTRTLAVKHDNPLQYTQIYDLLAISVKIKQNLLPPYINERIQLSQDELNQNYIVGGNNGLFYGYTKDLVGLRAPSTQIAEELRDSWIKAIKDYPRSYLAHRWDNFLSLLRIGQSTAAYVANPLVVENEFGIKFNANEISDFFDKEPSAHPWIFYPWLYVLLTFISAAVLFLNKKHRLLAAVISGSSLTFIAAHFFIAPASDFRYLYYSYFCALIVASFAVFSLKPLHNDAKQFLAQRRGRTAPRSL
ncbi:hypothetical protein ASD07_20250 [Duganella sp. Root336D2]|nr:hypothetical protein ASD07_20250 [Duganella sp. Root336D2]